MISGVSGSPPEQMAFRSRSYRPVGFVDLHQHADAPRRQEGVGDAELLEEVERRLSVEPPPPIG
jgi:hypothetical protein